MTNKENKATTKAAKADKIDDLQSRIKELQKAKADTFAEQKRALNSNAKKAQLKAKALNLSISAYYDLARGRGHINGRLTGTYEEHFHMLALEHMKMKKHIRIEDLKPKQKSEYQKILKALKTRAENAQKRGLKFEPGSLYIIESLEAPGVSTIALAVSERWALTIAQTGQYQENYWQRDLYAAKEVEISDLSTEESKVAQKLRENAEKLRIDQSDRFEKGLEKARKAAAKEVEKSYIQKRKKITNEIKALQKELESAKK